MKKGFYIRLAGEGISKNRKLYFPYILTCICMIMMYYIVSFLSISKELASYPGRGNASGTALYGSVCSCGIRIDLSVLYELVSYKEKEERTWII